MAELKDRIVLAKERLTVKLNPRPTGEGFAEHAYNAGLRHAKEHPGCIIAQNLRSSGLTRTLMDAYADLNSGLDNRIRGSRK